MLLYALCSLTTKSYNHREFHEHSLIMHKTTHILLLGYKGLP